MLRQMNNEDLFKLYDSDLVLRLHNAKNLTDTRKMLTRYRKYLGDYPPSPDLVKSFLAQYTNRKPRTLYRYAQMLRVFMKWYGEPMDDFKVKVPKSLPPYTEDAEIERLFHVIENKKTHKSTIVRDSLMIELALKTGLRRGELSNLEAKDVHPDFLIVRDGKGGKDRVIPLSAPIALRLKNFIEGKTRDQKVFGLKPASITMKIKAFARRAGLKNLHAHTLRHKFATDLLEHGADIRSVQHLLGHENLSTTQVYLSITDKRLREAINLLDEPEEKRPIELENISRESQQHSIVVLKAVCKPSRKDPMILSSEYHSHFIAYNDGNEPAIEVELALLDHNQRLLEGYRETVLRVGEELEFNPILLNKPEGRYYIFCQYRSIIKKTWDQVWLPFNLKKASREGEVYIIAGELISKNKIPQEVKIEMFWNKPK